MGDAPMFSAGDARRFAMNYGSRYAPPPIQTGGEGETMQQKGGVT